MTKNNIFIKSFFSLFMLGSFFSIVFSATTQKGREILDQLKDDGRTTDEIRQAMKDLGYNPSEYLGNTSSNVAIINSNSTSNGGNGTTTKEGREILNKFRQDGWTDDQIKQALEDLGLDYSGYFSSTNTNYNQSYTQSYNNDSLTYISRSCKPYSIQYNSSLNVYTSSDLKKTEYFVNIDYFKRYVDSKNVWNAECSPNNNWINYSYTDTSSSNERFTAPNGKVYFINGQNGSYTSNQLTSQRTFSTINELKNYIKGHNPLIDMESVNTLSHGTYQTNTSTHGSAEEKTEEDSSGDEIESSEDAKYQRDIARKNDISQIQTTIITSRIDNNKTWPGMKDNGATKGISMAEIAKDLEAAGLTYVPFDPISSNTVNGLGTIKGVGEYIYIVTKNNGIDNAGFVLMAKPETEEGANRIVCDGEKDFDNGYITNSTDIKDIQYCTSFIKTDYCKRDNQGRSNTQKCYYSDDSQLRYILTY